MGYFWPASEPVYDVIRHALPADMHLVTLATRDPQEAGHDQVDLEAAAQAGIPAALSCWQSAGAWWS